MGASASKSEKVDGMMAGRADEFVVNHVGGRGGRAMVVMRLLTLGERGDGDWLMVRYGWLKRVGGGGCT